MIEQRPWRRLRRTSGLACRRTARILLRPASPTSARAAAALALAVAFVPACGRQENGERKLLPGDSLELPAADSPAVPLERPAGETGGERGGAAGETGATARQACPQDSRNPGRIDLTAAWKDGHVRVRGKVEDGAGNALSLGLSQRGRFVYDEVFKSELLNVIRLESDSVDLTSVSYEPSASERAAFARTGAGPVDPSQPVCLDVSVYEQGTLDLLAAEHVPVAGARD